jgi:leucyl aminopeptidase
VSPASTGFQVPTVTVSSSLPKRKVDDSVLIVGVVDEDGTATLVANPFLDAEGVGEVEVALAALGAKGGAEQVTRVVAPSLPVASVLAVGLGKDRDKWPAEVIRRAAGVAARSLNGTENVITTLSDIDLEAAIEGLILGAYRFSDFRSEKTAPKDNGLRTVTALTADTKSKTKDKAERATNIATAVATARDFVNTPPSHLFPAEFASRAKALGEAVGLEVEVLDDKALTKQGYGGVVGVGKGSSRPPRLVRLIHRGAKNKKSKKVALVGKGITFDTGGISIKPAANMHHMTSDMGGAAAVIATVVLAAKQKLPIDVIATVPMAENMPSSTAQRPGDVLTQYGGITVEVLNTDAEGRLILADALALAAEDKPDAVVDVATLTGACMVALGDKIAGLMGNRDTWNEQVQAAADAVGEPVWPLPMPQEYRKLLESEVADLRNISTGSYGGALTAALFLSEFVDGGPWVHLDIAGPARAGGDDGYLVKGGTGFAVRTLVELVDRFKKPARSRTAG